MVCFGDSCHGSIVGIPRWENHSESTLDRSKQTCSVDVRNSYGCNTPLRALSRKRARTVGLLNTVGSKSLFQGEALSVWAARKARDAMVASVPPGLMDLERSAKT